MMLTQKGMEDIFGRVNAIITGDHFVYAKKPDGWYHGSDYVNKDAIYPYTQYVSALCREIAGHFLDISPIGCCPSVVVGPTVGAVSLAQWTASWLSRLSPTIEALAVCADEEDVLEQKEIDVTRGGVIRASGMVTIKCDLLNRVVVEYSEKTGTRRVIKRGYDKHVKGMKCLIVEDVINSGVTVAKTRDAIIAVGGEVVGVGALCNRSGGKVTAQTLCVPELFSLLNVDMKMFPEDECPICKERGPKSVRTDIGKGKEFLTRKGLV